MDDEIGIQKILTRYLEDVGYHCQATGDVDSAITLLAENQFDLLLCDLKMPGKSGIELIKFSKKQYPHIGRVMITAYSSQDIASAIMDIGVYGYIIKPISRNVVLITVENALRHLELDLHMQATKEELERKVSHRSEKLTTIMDNLNAGIVMLSLDMEVLEVNKKMREWFPLNTIEPHPPCTHICSKSTPDPICHDCPMKTTLTTGKIIETTKRIGTVLGPKDFKIVTSPIIDTSGNIYAGIAFYEDYTDKIILENDLRQAQKLEAVGLLASGIAHEINSPIQYIGDNIRFLQDAFADITQVLRSYSSLWDRLNKKNALSEEMNSELTDIMDEADLDYLFAEVPNTITQSLDGVTRVDKIVRAMKDFSHPDSDDKVAANINKIIESTATVCKNEWKYAANLVKNLATGLPVIQCYPSEISQVILNIIVNGAHAIAEFTEDGKKGLGTITITTAAVDEGVEIRISDTGSGIPKQAQDRIFDPFFTTKSRGKGTGQGLAIAYRIIVDKHQGTIHFETEEEKGTTFIIFLPT